MGALMTCPNCGWESESVFAFCRGCGMAVPSGVAVLGRDPAAISTLLRWGVLAATVAVPLVGVIMGAIYLVDARVQQKALGQIWFVVGAVLTLVYALLVAWVG
jgi:hypothetical protein